MNELNNTNTDIGTSMDAQSTIQLASASTAGVSSNAVSFGIQAADYFYSPLGFLKDVQEFSLYNRKTGFDNLDEKQGALYPGLYALGAVPSIGKTTFASQIADNLAENLTHVLFFSFEQSAGELYAKCIARELYKMRSNTADPNVSLYSSTQIRKGEGMNDIYQASAIDSFIHKVGRRLTIIPCMFSFTVEKMIARIDGYIKNTGVKPVVIVDYLQIVLASIDGNRIPDTRAAIDHVLRSLKTYQLHNNLSIILISSLNRSNYLSLIDFESFKESGGIEYTADVIWGLQLQVMHNEIFTRESKLNDKREVVRKAKKEVPREIELVCLKNRFGMSGYTCLFDYYPASDYFRSAGIQEE